MNRVEMFHDDTFGTDDGEQMPSIAGIESPTWFKNDHDNSENVRIVATLQPSGEWWAVDPYEGLWAVSEKTPREATLRMEEVLRWYAKRESKRLPDNLFMVFVDEGVQPSRDRVKHSVARRLTESADHAWNPAWKALAI